MECFEKQTLLTFHLVAFVIHNNNAPSFYMNPSWSYITECQEIPTRLFSAHSAVHAEYKEDEAIFSEEL